MILKHLKIHQFRNFLALSLRPHPRINLIYGENGSGKTNLLEAIHHLSTGKSFRTTLSSRVIHHGAEACQIHGLIQKDFLSLSVGIERHRHEPSKLYLNQAPSHAAELVSHFPLRLINPDSFNFLVGGPAFRRQLLNWGVFHVEPSFWLLWRQTQRILKQRNALLKKGQRKELKGWDEQLVNHANQLVPLYKQYFSVFEPIFNELIKQFLPKFTFKLSYHPGWDEKIPLIDLLESNYPKDQAQARTHAGPHRADIKIRCNKHLAKEFLSRGQQKLLVCALILAQGMVLKEHHSLNCTYLLDDLAAELDPINLKRVCDLLNTMEAQVFITSSDNKLTESLFSANQISMFHVEQLCSSKIPDLEESVL